MNANDVMGGLEKEITKMYGEGHSCAERNVLREAIGMIDRFRIRDTATEPPTEEDANEKGFILAWCEDFSNHLDSRWSIEPCRYVTEKTAKIFPKWTQLPETKGDEV